MHSSGGQKPGTEVLVGPCALQTLWGERLLHLFQLLVAPANLGLCRNSPISAVVTWLLFLCVSVSQPAPSCEVMATGFRAQPAPVWASQLMLVVKNLSANAGDARDTGSTLGSRRSPGEGNGNPFRYSCLENPMDRGARQTYFH